MKRSCLTLAAVAVLFAAPAVAAPALTPVAEAGRTTAAEQGDRSFLVSKGAATQVALAPAAELNARGRFGFLVVVINGRGGPASVDESAITVRDDQGRPVELYGRRRMEAETKAVAAKKSFQAMAGMQAVGDQGPANTFKGVSSAPSEGAPGQGGNQLATNVAQGEAGRADAATTVGNLQSTDRISAQTMPTTTLAPGQTLTALFLVDKPVRGAEALEVEIRIGADVHRFRYAIGR